MTLKIYFIGLAMLTMMASCKGQTPVKESENKVTSEIRKFNEDSLLSYVKYLSSDALEGRRVGSEGSAKAREFIMSKFKVLGVNPLGDRYEQPFDAESRKETYSSNNILGVVKGTQNPDKYIVISAHYDHEGTKKGEIYNGADDNASGTSALLSFAEYLKNNPPKHSVILAAFDAEELGLLGAMYFVDHSIVELENITANINMDMISRSDTHTLWVLGPHYYEQMRPLVPAQDSTEIFKVKIGHEGLDDKANWTNSSDQAAFHKKGIPFLFFTVDDHPDYHKPTDDFENIDPVFYIQSVQTIISVFEELDYREQ